MPGMVIWFKRKIYLDELYFVYFRDQKREMTKKELATYNAIQQMKGNPKAYYNELLSMNPVMNPNVTPVTGRQLIDYATEHRLIPLFDKYFDDESCAKNAADGLAKNPQQTHRVTLIPAQGMEFFLNNSFVLNS